MPHGEMSLTSIKPSRRLAEGSIKERRVCGEFTLLREDRAPRGDRAPFLSFQGRRSDAQHLKPNSQLQGH